jgi:hypothetical protein
MYPRLPKNQSVADLPQMGIVGAHGEANVDKKVTAASCHYPSGSWWEKNSNLQISFSKPENSVFQLN